MGGGDGRTCRGFGVGLVVWEFYFAVSVVVFVVELFYRACDRMFIFVGDIVFYNKIDF